MTPYDVISGQRQQISQRIQEVKSRTLEARKRYNHAVSDLPPKIVPLIELELNL